MKCKKLRGLRLGLVGVCLYFCSSIATAVEPVAPQKPPLQRAPVFVPKKQCTQDRIRYELSTIKKTVSQMGSEFCNPWGFAGNRVDDNLKCHTVAARIASYLISTVQPCCVYITMMQALKIPFGLRSHTLVGVFAPPYRGGVSPSSRDWLLSIEGWGTSCPPKITMGEAEGFDAEVLFSDEEIPPGLKPIGPDALYCTEAVKITGANCSAYSLDFIPYCVQGNDFADACSHIKGVVSYIDWASKRGMGCDCGNRFETLYLEKYLKSKGVDIDTFTSECNNLIQITKSEGNPCERCKKAGGTMDACIDNRSNYIGGCFCKKFEGGNEYRCILDEIPLNPPYLYTSCASVDTTSINCVKPLVLSNPLSEPSP